jgi:XTP/dITP diphosphohydrolase
MNLLVATSNVGKAREFAQMFGDLGLTCADLSAHKDLTPPEETGATFRANACLKASYYAAAIGQWTLADDSGLEVDAIDRKPGVVSARWAELHDAGKGDQANNTLLLKQLDAVPDEKRTARFVCVLALADPQGRIVLTTRETVEGKLLRALRGTGGFGYDPLFMVEELGKTTAELAPADKHRVSHRGKAMRRLHELIVQHGLFK